MELSKSSKHLRFLSPNTPKDANRHHLPNRSTPRPSRFPPTSKQVNNSSRHNPRHTKTIKNFSPQSVSHITVKKKMIYRFPISLAQATSVHNDDMPLPEIVHSKDLAEICWSRPKKPPSKEPESVTHSSKGSHYYQSKLKIWRRTWLWTNLSWRRSIRAYLHDLYSSLLSATLGKREQRHSLLNHVPLSQSSHSTE
jgi:hypothetical protein